MGNPKTLWLISGNNVDCPNAALLVKNKRTESKEVILLLKRSFEI
tara:strand:+ start:1345 stop:1479 length:135 start_codon:yes stop_codon:yes gene_type:complete